MLNSHAKMESHITRGNLGESFHLPWPSSDREAIKSLIFYTCSCVPGYWCYLCVHASHSAPRSVRSAQLYKDLVRGVCICQCSVCKLINEVPCAHPSGRCKQRNCSRSGELHRSSLYLGGYSSAFCLVWFSFVCMCVASFASIDNWSYCRIPPLLTKPAILKVTLEVTSQPPVASSHQ